MIRRLLARLMPRRPAREPRIYAAGDHPVRREQVARSARTVVEKLHDAGFKAFVVGGAVRDLMLGLTPKDFDIATDATPEQVKPLFRRAYIIGRRFRLVHVHVGADVLEVSTFRAAAERRGVDRRARPPALRQRVRLAGRGRRPPGLHDQRALLRPLVRRGVGLRGRRGRHPREATEADRPARHALSRGPGAHVARGATRGQGRPCDRSQVGGADHQARAASSRTCRPLDCSTRCRSSSFPAMPWRRLQASARTACRTVSCRCSTSSSSSRSGRASSRSRSRAPTRACARASRCRRRSCSPRSSGTKCCSSGTPRSRKASDRCRRCTTRWTACWKRRRRASRSRAGSRRRSRRSGRCSRASSSARASARIACSSTSASAPPTTSCRCAPNRARRPRRWSNGGRASRMRRHAEREAMLRPDEAPQQVAPLARPRPQASRGGRATRSGFVERQE